MKNQISLYKWALILCTLACITDMVRAQDSAASSKPLIDFSSPDAGKQVAAAKGLPAGSSVSVDKAGIEVNFTPWQKGDADHPGFHITPAMGTSWDLSAYGHVEAKITNTGTAGINIVMHVVPTGEGPWTERNMEAMQIKPGETKTLKVIFGYSKGFKPVVPPAFNAASVAEVYIYLYHSIQPHTFRVDELKAAGTTGEKPDAAPTPVAK